MDSDELGNRFPRLYHMAEDGSWPLIQRLGLLSTSALLDAFEVNGDPRDTITSARRPASVVIEHPVYGRAVVRDQIPLNDEVLARVLEDGLTSRDWHHLLNAHVFFWPTQRRLATLLSARAYRDRVHTVLTIDTRALVELHGDQIRLSPINSGNTLFDARPRGRATLSTVEAYPFDDRRRLRGPSAAIAEVAVMGGIQDIDRVVVAVDRRHRDRVIERLFNRDANEPAG